MMQAALGRKEQGHLGWGRAKNARACLADSGILPSCIACDVDMMACVCVCMGRSSGTLLVCMRRSVHARQRDRSRSVV